MKAALLKAAVLIAGAVSVTACTGIRDHRGAVIDPQLAAAVQPGVDNKESVTKTLGRPTFMGQFDQNDWYYVSRDTNTVAFRGPRVSDQTVLHVRFDQAGNVASVNKTGKELIAAVNPSNAATPTLGRKKSFFEELFGNIGALGTGGAATGATPDR